MEPNLTAKAFGQFLSDRKLLTASLFDQALEVSRANRDSIVRSISKLGLLPERQLADALAEFSNFPRYIHSALSADRSVNLSPEYLRHHSMLPINHDGETLTVVCADPLDAVGLRGLEFATDLKIKAVVATLNDVDSALSFTEKPDEFAMLDLAASKDQMVVLKDLASDAPAIRWVQNIITQAVDKKASDIHVEPVESAAKVRFRMDGVLQEVDTLPASYVGPVVSRIKVMAKLNIAERRLPQDGRLRVMINGKSIDFRVATSPTLHGESVVLRILDRDEVELDFVRLGFDSHMITTLQHALQRPYGIILSTGPTGSGKTTTLYTALKELNRPDRKILTVEDPIEYTLEGINQTQVKPQIGYTFAAALRAFLRQDPDVLMVGEIRDRDTTEIAIQAALTGHLLLSTLHTNTAAAAIVRLLDMGIDDYLLTSTINLIIGQRLVRRLCIQCREAFQPSEELIRHFGIPVGDKRQSMQLHRARGCSQCSGTGYFGRTGLMELMELTSSIKNAILTHADAGSIEKLAVENGMRTMFRHGIDLALNGETTLEEVQRVTHAGE